MNNFQEQNQQILQAMQEFYTNPSIHIAINLFNTLPYSNQIKYACAYQPDKITNINLNQARYFILNSGLLVKINQNDISKLSAQKLSAIRYLNFTRYIANWLGAWTLSHNQPAKPMFNRNKLQNNENDIKLLLAYANECATVYQYDSAELFFIDTLIQPKNTIRLIE